jgi:hypothetical protein
LIGGGFITALAVPIISDWGLTPFTIATVVISVAFAIWGIRRRASETAALASASSPAPSGPG